MEECTQLGIEEGTRSAGEEASADTPHPSSQAKVGRR